MKHNRFTFTKRIGNSVRDFAEHTSAHGIPRAFTSHGGLRKGLWLLLFFTCLIAFIAQAVQIVKRFARNDIIVGVELRFENIPFPSVTVCNLNPYKNSLARAMGSVKDTLMAFDTAMEKSESHSRSKRSIDPNFQQKAKELYEKMHSGYEGLLAAYSFCNCPVGQPDCTALKKNTNGSLCMCFYNSKNDNIWPCYLPKFWSERKCKSCGALGNCEFTDIEEEGKLPCLCVPKIRLCVRIEEKEPELSVIDIETNVESPDNQTKISVPKKARLDNRLLKVWQITTTPAPISLVDEEIADKEAAYGLKGINDPVAIRATAIENLIFAVNELNSTEIGRLGYDKREFITKCAFNGRQCSVENDFSVYIDASFGNCFTFNYNASKDIRSERAGSNYGLRFQVFVNISDYLPTTEAAGVRITVHSPKEQPFPDTHGYSAPTGFVSSFAIRLKRMNRLPAPYGDCVEKGKTDDYIYTEKEYSTEGCQRSCIQKHLVRKCGCGDPRFPSFRNFSNCPVAVSALRDCIRAEIKYAARTENCICKQPCKQQVYSVSYSCARWPSGPEAGTAKECGPNLSPAECLKFHREESALIEVFFEQLNYESLMESEAYGFPNLLSDFGGQLGLWLGVSVITMMEVGILVTEICLSIISSFLCPCFRVKDQGNIDYSPDEESKSIVANDKSKHSSNHNSTVCNCQTPNMNGVDIIRTVK